MRTHLVGRRAADEGPPQPVSAVRALLEDEPLQGYWFDWFDRTREHADWRRGIAFERLSYARPYTVHLTPLPCWEHLSAPEDQRRIAEIVADIESQAALRRQIHDRPAKDPESVLSQEPHGAPETLKKSPAPLFHAASRKVRQELYEGYKYFVAAFKDAAARLRADESDVLFPAGSSRLAVGEWVGYSTAPLIPDSSRMTAWWTSRSKRAWHFSVPVQNGDRTLRGQAARLALERGLARLPSADRRATRADHQQEGIVPQS